MVGKSDFNENPVVSLDLDLDFDLGFVNLQPFFLPEGKCVKCGRDRLFLLYNQWPSLATLNLSTESKNVLKQEAMDSQKRKQKIIVDYQRYT